LKRLLAVVLGGTLIAALLAFSGGPAISVPKAGGATAACAEAEGQASGLSAALRQAPETQDLQATEQLYNHAIDVVRGAITNGCTEPVLTEFTTTIVSTAGFLGIEPPSDIKACCPDASS